jgi:hypothetical protein
MQNAQTIYQTVWQLALNLTPDDQLKLAGALIEHLHGFGMWKDRADMEDIQSYVESIRKRDSYHPDGRLKTPEEFLRELEVWKDE